MAKDLATVLKENFLFFEGVVREYIDQHEGEFALVHGQSVVGFYERPFEAAEAGYAQFSDGLFSIQKVSERPADLGFMAYGAGDRSTD